MNLRTNRSPSRLGKSWVGRTATDARTAAGDLVGHPARLATLIVCTAAVKSSNLLALYAALWAFDGDVATWRVAVVYLVGATAAEIVPTPAGLGTVDAALIAGLVTTGVGGGATLAAVIVYRLLSFWAPIVPGLDFLGHAAASPGAVTPGRAAISDIANLIVMAVTLQPMSTEAVGPWLEQSKADFVADRIDTGEDPETARVTTDTMSDASLPWGRTGRRAVRVRRHRGRATGRQPLARARAGRPARRLVGVVDRDRSIGSRSRNRPPNHATRRGCSPVPSVRPGST